MKIKKILVVIWTLCFVLALLVACDSGDLSTQINSEDYSLQTEGEIVTTGCTHSWREATCEKSQTCLKCGKISGSALGHTTDQGECSRCDKYIGTPPTSPRYISNRSINHKDDLGYFYFLFSFLDEDENEIKAGATVDIRIVNSADETVYVKTHKVTEKNFGTWQNKLYNKKWLAASIYIYDTDIAPGTSDSGKLYYTITSADGISWDEYSLDINGDLPLKETTVILPTLPVTIYDYTYKGDVDSSVRITNITYEISGDDLYFYFTGEKTYDAEGDRYSQSCAVGWKLYDSEGYIVESGTFYSPNIAVGEKFRDEKEYAFGVIRPGETYTLVISSVD